MKYLTPEEVLEIADFKRGDMVFFKEKDGNIIHNEIIGIITKVRFNPDKCAWIMYDVVFPKFNFKGQLSADQLEKVVKK